MIAVVLVAMALLQSPPASLRSLDKGSQTQTGARQVVARSVDEWTGLWRAHRPDEPRPAVDFAREMVVAVFAGERPTGGFGVEIVEVKPEGSSLVVRYRETAPGRGAMTAQIMTSPYHIVAVPKQAGDVRFEKVP